MLASKRRFILVAALAAFSVSAAGQADLLPPEEAFRASARQVAPGVVEIAYTIAPGYYLYRERFAFSTQEAVGRIVSVAMPEPRVKHDRALDVPVAYYAHQVVVRVAVEGAGESVQVIAKAQGCAEVGVCYPPLTRTYRVSLRGGMRG
ncbi:MAG: protein-disulfide reductase DsbD N-terminal domain-containing protein [FCB group bacterium]|jgi:thiol:disulfide interchange protein DsbD|nr:protein-disulfide reductase DsbD N-terminal domain-containing protein [FCB group bacterium]